MEDPAYIKVKGWGCWMGEAEESEGQERRHGQGEGRWVLCRCPPTIQPAAVQDMHVGYRHAHLNPPPPSPSLPSPSPRNPPSQVRANMTGIGTLRNRPGLSLEGRLVHSDEPGRLAAAVEGGGEAAGLHTIKTLLHRIK